MSLFNPKLREEDFMSELEAATRLRPASAATFMLFSIMALVLLAIFWSAFAKIEVLSRGQGQVVPSQDVQIVQSLEGGIIEEILVKQGQKVERGQVLVRLSDVQFSSEAGGVEARFLGLSAKKARLKSEADGSEFVMPADVLEKAPAIAANEKALYESRQNELRNAYAILDDRIAKARAQLASVNAEINQYISSRKLLNDELAITREMVKKRAVPKLEEIRLNREINDLSGQINSSSAQKNALTAELSVAQNERKSQLDRFQSQALGELNGVETEIASLSENMKSNEDRVFRREIRSPVDGVVNNFAVRTIGGVVEPAMQLVEIVPVDDELKIIARIAPNEIAFIQVGQPAKVKITAYDPQKYGALDGELVRIGATSIKDGEGNPGFEIEIHTAKNFLGTAENPLPITPGMIADVEVITGKRSILEYLLKPILRARDRALTER